eukprot:3697348-Pleurochrysis_carterae.AAC.2
MTALSFSLWLPVVVAASNAFYSVCSKIFRPLPASPLFSCATPAGSLRCSRFLHSSIINYQPHLAYCPHFIAADSVPSRSLNSLPPARHIPRECAAARKLLVHSVRPIQILEPAPSPCIYLSSFSTSPRAQTEGPGCWCQALVTNHTRQCRAGDACGYPRCALSKRLMRHHRECPDQARARTACTPLAEVVPPWALCAVSALSCTCSRRQRRL